MGQRVILPKEGAQKRFEGTGEREEEGLAGGPRDCPTLHLPVGVSLWKSTSELKPNKKVN